MRTETTVDPSSDPRERAEIPLVMLAEDVARALGLRSASAARRVILRGECGPYSRRGRRILVRRESFLDALRAREVGATETVGPGGAARQREVSGLARRVRKNRTTS